VIAKRDYGETCSNAIMKALNNSLWRGVTRCGKSFLLCLIFDISANV
jgi:hypothetical protein